jgi:hypothetical protein
MIFNSFRKGLGFTCSCLERACTGTAPAMPADLLTSDAPRLALEARSWKLAVAVEPLFRRSASSF